MIFPLVPLICLIWKKPQQKGDVGKLVVAKK